jgi:hypothetical protein
MADLPFQLIGGENEEPFAWKTSGEQRRLEEDVGYFPVMSDCGQGLVYSFAGAVDSGKAMERFGERTVDQDAADAEIRTCSSSPRQNGSTAGAVDSGKAMGRFVKRTVDQEAADAESRICSNSPRQNDTTARALRGGVFTTAFGKSVLATGKGSIAQGLQELRDDVRDNNAAWKAEIQKGDQQAGTNNWERHKEVCEQEPSFGSSHFCHLDRTLFM